MEAFEEIIEPEAPKSIGLLSNNEILIGSPTPAIDKLKIMSDGEFEDMVREWIAGYCKKTYKKVRRAGGARDKGRDVIAFIDDESKDWHNFQCKHYKNALTPGDIWLELGKLCYYTSNGDYVLPKKYYFVAPQGVGPTLGDYLDIGTKLKEELLKVWDKECKTLITSKKEIPLTEELKKHIEGIDFGIFTYLDPQELIEQHKKTSYFAARFGGGLQNRPRPDKPPEELLDAEVRYVEQLFEAYSDKEKKTIKAISELDGHSDLKDHFNRQRECFYWAEALDQFGRDKLPHGNNCFTDLKDEIYHGVVDTANGTHSDGYERLTKTTTQAVNLNLKANALVSVTQTQDKIGICHHLANENKLKWVKK